MFWGSSSGGPSSSSSGAASDIMRIFGYDWFTVLWVVILVSSSLVVQLSESFQTTTFTSSTRHVTIDHIQQHQKGHFCQTFPTSVGQSVRRHVGTTVLSSQQQQSTIEEKEKPMTKKKLRTWEESFQLLVSYKEQHGNCNVPYKYEDDSRLGYWVSSQRKRKDRLSDERIAKLDDLGFSWSNELYEEQWEECFQLLVSYKEKHGNCNVPDKYKDDSRLGYWVSSQRKRKDRLSDERIVKLDDLGFSWSNEINEEQWEVMFQKLVVYSKENDGDCNVPRNNDNNDVDKELRIWVTRQRKRKSLLSMEQRTRLDNIGLIWEDSKKVKADQKWNEKYELLQEYKQKYGHCMVPRSDPSLGPWVHNQRQQYRKGQLREDRQMKLEEMDFTWKVRDGNAPDYVKLNLNWVVKFGILLNFLEEHGHCNVPQLYKKDKSLGIWVYHQRKNEKDRTLQKDRKEQLDDIGFTWSFDGQKDSQWNEKYKELIRFKEKNGHLRLPETSKSLSKWVTEQRVMFAAGRMLPERKALWDIETRST